MLYRSSSHLVGSPRRLAIFPILLLLVFLLLCYYLTSWRDHSAQNGSRLNLAANLTTINHTHAIDQKYAMDDTIEHLREIADWVKPAEMKVIALVFYGRRRFVRILDCYLRVHISLLILYIAQR